MTKTIPPPPIMMMPPIRLPNYNPHTPIVLPREWEEGRRRIAKKVQRMNDDNHNEQMMDRMKEDQWEHNQYRSQRRSMYIIIVVMYHSLIHRIVVEWTDVI